MIGLGGSSAIQLGIAVRLHNHFSSQAAQIAQSMIGLTGSVTAMKTQFQYSAEAMRDFGFATLGAGLAISAGIAKAIDAGSKFQDHMIATKAIMGDVNFNMEHMSGVARSMAKQFPVDAIEMAEAMKDLAKAGLSAAEIPDVLRAIATTAVAADEKMSGVGGVSERFIDMMKAWGLSSKDAMPFADLAAMTANLSTVSFADIFESMKYAQSTFMSMKIPLEDTMALIGALGSAGLKQSMGGTSLSNTLRFLAKAMTRPTGHQKSALAALGLTRADIEDSKTGMIDIIGLIGLLAEKTKNMKPLDVKNTLESLFGERGSRIQPLIEQLKRRQDEIGIGLVEFRDRLKNKSKGEADRVFQERMTSFMNQAKLLKNALVDLKISIFNAIAPALTYIVKGLTWVALKLSSFASTGFGKIVVTFVAITGVILTVVGAFNLLTSAMVLFSTRFLMGMRYMGQAARFGWFTSLASLFGLGGRGAAAGAGTGLIGALRAFATSLRTWGPTLVGLFTGRLRLNSAGRLITAATGRFATGGGVFAAGGWVSTLANLAIRFRALWVTLGPLIRGFSAVGLISLALSAFGISLKNQFNLLVGTIKWVIGSLVNVVFEMMSWLPGVKAHDWAATQKRVYNHSFGGTIQSIQNENAAGFTKSPSDQSDSFLKRTFKDSNSKYVSGATSAVINIHVDGKKSMSNLVSLIGENNILANNLV